MDKHITPATPSSARRKSWPWAWVPSLYFAEGLPYVIVITLSVVMYKQLGLSNAEVAYYTGWFYLPWLIKPLWSPFVDLLKTKRWWIVTMQLLMGAGMAGIAFTLPMESYLQWTLAIFWLMAFSSATHDIAADGFYILGLTEKEQAFYVGWRSTFYRIGTIFCQGGLVFLAGMLQKHYSIPLAWSMTMGITAAIMILLAAWHNIMLPKESSIAPAASNCPNNERVDELQPVAQSATCRDIITSFKDTLRVFLSKKGLVPALLFMLLFRFPEAQLAKMAQPFIPLCPKTEYYHGPMIKA